MPVAIRAATRIQDMDDANVSLGVGVDEYALVYDHDTARFVLRAMAGGVTAHGALTGLANDDHTGYTRLTGRAGGQVLYGGTAANEALTLEPTSHATKTTASILLAPSGGNVGVGVAIANTKLDVAGIVSSGATGGSGEFRSYQDSFAGNNYVSLRTDTSAQKSGLYRNGTPAFFAFYDTGSGNVALSANFSGASIAFQIGGVEKARVSNGGRLGIGTAAPGSLIHGLLTSAATSAVTNVLIIGHDTSGTAAVGFGAGQLFALQTSTTAAQSAARIQALWYEATHATRKADLVLTAYDSGGEREGLRIRGDGSAPAIGFYGVAPIARATLATGAGATVDNVITALQNLGLVKQS